MIVIGLALVTFLAYEPLRGCDFIALDDPAYVTLNTHVQGGLTAANVYWALTSFEVSNWHPLTWISHMADVHLFELDPAAHHFSSLFFHVLTAAVLFVLLRRITGAIWRSALVAALFALHPLNVESVAWIAERKNLISTLFFLLTIWAYVSYLRKNSVRAYCEVFIVFALGLMAKPMLVTLPCVLLLLDFWPLGRLQLPEIGSCGKQDELVTRGKKIRVWYLVAEKLPLLLLSSASSVLTIKAQSNAISSSLPLSLRLANAAVSYGTYLYRMIWPVNLAVIYPYDRYGLNRAQLIASVILLLSFTVIALWKLKSAPYIALGWFWYLGTLVPVIGILQVGIQANADRYTYLPLIGIFIVIAWSLGALADSAPKIKVWVAAACIICLIALGLRTRGQIRYWHDSIPLFQHASDVTQGNYAAQYYIALALEQQRHEPDAAFAHYSSALKMDPSSGFKPYLLERMGKIREMEGNWVDAEYYFNQAVNSGGSYSAFTSLASVLYKKGEALQAERNFRYAIHLSPLEAKEARLQLGMLLAKQNKNAGAVEQYTELLKQQGSDASVFYLVAQAEHQAGNVPAAIEACRNALRLEPNFLQASQKLELLLRLKQEQRSYR